MRILSQYRASLKRPEAEELLDLWIYRPIAFVLAKLLVLTPATPNHITAAALASALAAGIALSLGTRSGFVAGAVLYALANVLDCCDGMVARLKGNGTQIGRMIDVFADTVSGAIVYLGLGIGLARSGVELPLPVWPLVALGGISFALQSALFDRERNLFLAGATQATIEREVAAVAARFAGAPSALRVLARVYIRYMRWQQRETGPVDARALRLWSLTGSTTHVTVVAATLLLDAPMALFAYTIVIGNLWNFFLTLRRSAMRTPSNDSPSDDVVAVILAAGAGTRLRPLTDDIPKPLVPVGGVPLLSRSLDALVEAGVRRFAIVVGYRASRVEELLEREYPELDVEIIYNRYYDVSNNAASLLLATNAAVGARLLVLDGDLLYDRTILDDLLARDRARSHLVVRRTGDLGEEEMKVVLARDGTVGAIGKTLAPAACAGESIGIALFDARSTRRLFQVLDERMRRSEGSGEFYEAAFQQMIDEGLELQSLDAPGAACIEIDTLEDLADAELLLLASERGSSQRGVGVLR